MTKINLEKFEQEYMEEINAISSLRFEAADVQDFVFPTHAIPSPYWAKRAIGIAFAMPAFAFVLAFFFYTGKTTDGNLAMLEDSNTRILNQINTLDTQ